MVNRTGEVALSVIATILNMLVLGLLLLGVLGTQSMNVDEFNQEMSAQLQTADPTLSEAEIQQGLELFGNVFGVVGWVLIVLLAISIILSLLGIAKATKNRSPKSAGFLFILAGLFSGIILLAPILLYIAAIMCFVRKARVEDQYYDTYSRERVVEEPVYRKDERYMDDTVTRREEYVEPTRNEETPPLRNESGLYNDGVNEENTTVNRDEYRK
ncbi:DUF4064 domain-containing protein [Paenisporosarcina cavernae]|uniref:DUF4064 domain-containing protein n=1 Tax=Paenisporosarcina cavernae TaxID=2320858 RepID=A0A385YXR1_9BACL|nr:DUF4064 domain-containing protein [Paenisporosarcina cavernae]AYC30388.1 DUF4064 domain-containing protein [Paenisporosarcina cavernae]